MDQESFREESLALVGRYFGEHSRQMYMDFSEDQAPEALLSALQQMLPPMIGPAQAKKALLALRKKYFLPRRNG